MAKPKTILKIDRGARGELHVTLEHTPEGVAYVELAHHQPNGALSRGSTVKATELPALVAALSSLDVRLRQKAQQDRRPGAVAREIRDEMAAAQADMEAF